MDGVSVGASTVASSSVAILMPSAAESFIVMPRLCTEIIEDSLPGMGHSERTGLAQPVTDMRAHLEATRRRPTASRAAIAGQPLTGALKVTELTQATGVSPALDANQARGRADSLHMEAPAIRTVVDTLAADMPVAGMPAVDTAAVKVTVAADTAASAKCSV
jgi:hypothetical protein